MDGKKRVAFTEYLAASTGANIVTPGWRTDNPLARSRRKQLRRAQPIPCLENRALRVRCSSRQVRHIIQLPRESVSVSAAPADAAQSSKDNPDDRRQGGGGIR